MTKGKAICVDLIVTAALGAMLWGLWSGAIRSFYVAAFILAGLGFLMIPVLLYKYLMAPPVDLWVVQETAHNIGANVKAFFENDPDPLAEEDEKIGQGKPGKSYADYLAGR